MILGLRVEGAGRWEVGPSFGVALYVSSSWRLWAP